MTEDRPKVCVGVIIYNDRGEILMVRSHKWKDQWVIPAGGLEWGESIEECARREVKEETGLEITDVELVGVQDNIFPEDFHKSGKHMVFLDYCARYVSGEVVLNDELEEFKWLLPQEALDTLEVYKSTQNFIRRYMELKR